MVYLGKKFVNRAARAARGVRFFYLAVVKSISFLEIIVPAN